MKLTANYLKKLIGNPRAYAVQDSDGAWRPMRRPLTVAALSQHLRGDITVGTYVVDGDRARTLVFDIDDDDLDLAHAIRADLEDLGVPPSSIGIEFSGRKGYHVWVVLAAPALAAGLRRLGLQVREDVERPKLEVFPKQAQVRDLGSLVKLPGGVHRVTGKRNEFIDGFPTPMSPATLQEVLRGLPEESVRVYTGKPREPFPCMENIQAGVGEGGRNNALFHLAVMLRRGGVADEFVEHIIRTVNERNQPPLEAFEVEALLASSRESGPICSTLSPDVSCGDACIQHRVKGLYTRPGQLRYAGEGEHVVMTVEGRDGDRVHLRHEDLDSATAILNSGRQADGK